MNGPFGDHIPKGDIPTRADPSYNINDSLKAPKSSRSPSIRSFDFDRRYPCFSSTFPESSPSPRHPRTPLKSQNEKEASIHLRDLPKAIKANEKRVISAEGEAVKERFSTNTEHLPAMQTSPPPSHLGNLSNLKIKRKEKKPRETRNRNPNRSRQETNRFPQKQRM